jgi:putative intracellular protease/amidase
LGLICASTGLLGFVGNFNGDEKPIAEGKKVVGYFRVEGILKRLGKVQFIPGDPKGADAVVDGKLVTGRNPESSSVFADKVIETLAQSAK